MLYIVLTAQTILEFLIIGVLITCVVAIMIFVKKRYDNWTDKRRFRRIKKDYEKLLQLQRKRRIERDLRRKEQEKYPLFYWRETCVECPLKEGIV